jgi:hypothetical protein
MTDKQPEALRLAACLEEPDYCTILQMRQAAAELRRLHEVNAELVEALIDITNECTDGFKPHDLFVKQALAAIAKATGEQQ